MHDLYDEEIDSGKFWLLMMVRIVEQSESNRQHTKDFKDGRVGLKERFQ